MGKSKIKAPRTWTFTDFAACSILFGATLLAYSPALNGGLLWDDLGHVTKPELQSWHGLWRIWFDLGATQQYYPMLHTAFWFEHQLWGDAVLGYHLTNVALHSTAAYLIVIILRRLSIPGAWLAGFVFALHPVCVEAVAWISEQKSTLSAVFYLASALVYLDFDRTRRRGPYIFASALFAFALLSKTVTATLPAALLVLLWWLRGRLRWKCDVRPLLPWFAFSLASGVVTVWVETKFIGAEGADFVLTFGQRCLVAGRAIWFYLSKLIWPSNLMFTYPHWTLNPAEMWQYLPPLAAVALLAGLWRAARWHRGPLAGFLFFSGTLFPVLGFFNVYPFVYSYVADHFQYLASLGIIVPFAAGITLPTQRKHLEPFLAALLLIVLGTLTWRQSHIYRDAETLYRETLTRNPEDWMAYNNLGMDLARTPGGLQEAIADFEAALRIRPDLANVHNNLANALAEMPGRALDAITEYRAALRLKPDFGDVHLNLARTLSKIPDRLPEAVDEYQAALRLKPDDAAIHLGFGSVLAEYPGRLSDAVSEYQAALRLNPDYAEAHNNLGSAFSELPGHVPEALAEYEAAVRIKPDFAEAHYNLAVALAKIPGRLPEAINHLEMALQSRPDLAPVREALNRLRAAQSNSISRP